MISLDDVPCPMHFTMQELAEITLVATRAVCELSAPELLGEDAMRLSRSVAEACEHLRVLSGIVRKIDDSIRAHGLAEIEKALGPDFRAMVEKEL